MNDLVYDANSLFARSWFAAQRESADPKDAIRLALNTILLLLNPDTNKIGTMADRMLFAWDSQQNPAKHRQEKPPAYHDTKAILRDILEYVFSAVNVEYTGAEGDDIAATAVANAEKNTVTYVISGDKDLMQLQSPRCFYYSLQEKAILSRAFIVRKFGCIRHPNQIGLWLAIVGDPVDNISGVTGYGEKKCKQLFEHVTEEMTLVEAAQAVSDQIPEPKKQEFWESLGRTVLNCSVPGVPRPKPIQLIKPKEVEALGIPQISYYYQQVYHTYVVEPY